ncbi:LCP family protein [Naasia lichenicola]|nr:LCP family protein [Naasia lichenicola]
MDPATQARHRLAGRQDAAAPVMYLLRLLALALAVVVASVGSVAGIAVWSLTNQVTDNAIDIGNGDAAPIPSIGALAGSFNMLMVGADNAPDQSGFGETRDATLNDVNILIHVSADHQNVTVVSLPRDLVISQPECTDPTSGEVYDAVDDEPLNGAYQRGGLGCVVATVSAVTGLEIPYAALFTFAGTVAMADAVGGVPICLTDAIQDTDSGLDLPAGTSVVSGATALAYLRDRHGIAGESDLSRISSQQAYMSSLFRVMTSAGTLSDPTKLYGLAEAAATSISLSESLASVDRMVAMALAIKDVSLQNMVFVQYPVLDDPDDAAKVIPDDVLAPVLAGKLASDTPVVLSADSLGQSVTLDPSAPAPAASTDPVAPDPAATDAAGDPVATAPPVDEGLSGMNASQTTCSIAAD